VASGLLADLADFLSTRTGHVRVLPLYFTTLLLETIWY
jgi:hypothetical protein